ncbi:MAG: DUF1572 family protein [Terriglobia bacterium]
MARRGSDRLTKPFLQHTRHVLGEVYLPRIARCLALLSEKEVWWRPHATSNSVGNLVLHLEGNVRQWIIAGVGGAPDRRQRDTEFAARGPLPRRELVGRLRKTVNEACRIVARATPKDLARPRMIQGYRVTGFQALYHVTEHFAYHAGQIILITKMRRRRDLKFTHLPKQQPQPARVRRLPAI